MEEKKIRKADLELTHDIDDKKPFRKKQLITTSSSIIKDKNIITKIALAKAKADALTVKLRIQKASKKKKVK